MKIRILLLLMVLSVGSVFGQRTCLTTEKMNELIQADAKFAEHHRAVMNHIQTAKPENNFLARNPNTVVTIPVVFHVLYKNATQNISDAQIQSQLDVLNKDYRKLNTDFSTVVPAYFQTYAADMEILFCKATKTPAGAATTGIVRLSKSSTFVFGDEYYTSTGDPAWNPNKYLNVWIGILDGQFDGTLGWAYLPSAAGQAFDGFVCDYRYFGTMGTATAPYNKGRTCTHEIGHYFGLNHPWGTVQGISSTCGTTSNSDGVADTPAINHCHFSATYPSNTYTCTSSTHGAMFMNYMDYVEDAHMAMFSLGQKTIVQNTLNSSRSNLLTSAATNCSTLSVDDVQKLQAINVYPNPITTEFFISSPFVTIDEVEIFNINGALVKTVKPTADNYKVDVADLATGTYYLRMYSQNEYIKSDKIIKQ